MDLKYSVVIPTYNSSLSLVRVLEGLEAQTLSRGSFECVIVDDGSVDDTSSLLEQYISGTGITLSTIKHRKNYGRSVSRNDAWKQARGEYILFLDCDMVPCEKWLEEYDTALDGNDLDVVSGAITNSSISNPIGQHSHAIFEILESKFKASRPDSPQSEYWAFAAYASNIAIRRSLLDRVNGFNTFFSRFEDVELNLRLREAGARFAYADRAIAQHVGASKGEPQDLWFTGDELTRLFVRHPYRAVLLLGAWAKFHLQSPEATVQTCLMSLRGIEKNAYSEEDGLLIKFVAETFGSAPPIDCRYTLDEAIAGGAKRHHCTMLNGMSELERGLRDGLYTEVRDGVRYFDMEHTANWFAVCSRARTPDALVSWFTHRCTPYQNTLLPADAVAFHCRGTYEVSLPIELLVNCSGSVKINIPIPVAHPCQRNVQVSNCNPPELLDSLDDRQSMILRHVLSISGGQTARISYDFEYDIFEHVPVNSQSQIEREDENQESFLKPGLQADFKERALSILNRIIPDESADAYHKARSLYNWTWDNFEFIEFQLAFSDLLYTGYGACISRIKLFISLLRLAGIPSREQSGVFFGDGIYTGRSMSYFQQTNASTPFMHTWAEFYTPEFGWTPVSEFEAPTRVNSIAVLSDDDRQKVVRGSRRRCRSAFGSLDPFRIYGSTQANRLPTYPIVKTDKGWHTDPDLTAATLHTVHCHMDQI